VAINWNLFFETFLLIFLAELPDKTALAGVFLATQNRALPVFLGSAAAFLIQSIVGIAFGNLFTSLPERYVQMGAGILFLVFAVLVWRRKEDDEEEATGAPTVKSFWATAFSSFLVIFIAEWGDITQLATATLQAKYHDAVTILMASTLALWLVAALAVCVGKFAKNFIRPRPLQTIASIAFVSVGVFLLVKNLNN
jgi:Ca2+/H+ antiporter, TMEM165/GDT1 family